MQEGVWIGRHGEGEEFNSRVTNVVAATSFQEV